MTGRPGQHPLERVIVSRPLILVLVNTEQEMHRGTMMCTLLLPVVQCESRVLLRQTAE
jgi:hypothetical protein